MGPAPDESCHEMLQLGQLDLNLALMAFGPLREDIENQACPVNDIDFKTLFKIGAAVPARGRD